MFWRLVWTVIPPADIMALISAALSSWPSSVTSVTGSAASGLASAAGVGEPFVVMAHPEAASPTATAANAVASRRIVHTSPDANGEPGTGQPQFARNHTKRRLNVQ